MKYINKIGSKTILLILLFVGLLTACPLSADTTKLYKLTLKSNPSGAGSVSGGGNFVVGKSVNVSTYANSGYVFKGWFKDGENISKNKSINYTMPSMDVMLTAEYVFDPSSPSDPQPADTTKLYKLTLKSNPSGAGSVSGGGNFVVGKSVNVSTYANSGYVFKGWFKDGENISKNKSINYTMPSMDVMLTAEYVFDPSSPSEPQQPTLKYPLAVTASPKGAASFSYTGSEVALGAEYYVRATPKTGYKFKEWVVNGVVQTETSTTYNATMTEEGASVVGVFEFDPSSPSNPGANYYNSITGQAIIDDFTPGSLYSALSNVIGSSNYKNVSSLILKGRMDTYDYDCLSYFSNAGTIDLSRTGESTSVPNYAFEDMAVSNILLSSEVSRIGSYAFYNCSNLTSLTLYAQVPPICTNYTFNNFKNRDNCTVYVPASAIELYTTADYWKDFTILPITNDAHLLNVNLPAEAADGRYKHYSLEIVNINSGVRQKYVVSNRLLYTFNGLHKDEKYNIYLYSQSGFEIGKIENVIIPEDDIEVTFKDLKNLHTVNAKVLTADSIDVTSQVSIEWLKPLADGSITYIRKANSIGEIPEGEKLFCRISLDNNLGVMYLAPKDVEFIVKEKETTCSIILEPLRKIELSGTVLDGNGTVLSGASVSVNQSLNVKYNKTFTTKTDRNGMWKLSAFNVPETYITYAATECINVNDTIGAFELNASTFDVGKIVMKSIVGARITYGITYRSTLDDEPEEFYSDYKNVLISVYNKTQNREHSEISLQYPILAILDENINEGDELKLTATSKIGAFKPIEQIVKVGEDQRAEVSFDIVGKGAISASYEKTDNTSVIAMLYSSKGEFLKKTTYSGLTVKFTELEDGDYTLVTMGQSDLMNSVLRLSNFSEIGLTEGKDYLKNNIKVETGVLSVVKNTIIPTFDESIFYYTNTSTGFSFNKSSVTTGSYLTLRSTIGFKGFYENDISNVALVVDLPEFCDFVEQSVIQGPNMLPYTFDNNRLTVQLGKDYKSLVRFCVLPTKGGSLNVTASVVFDYKGETITQPIGAAISEIKDIEITVPSVVAATSFKVTGTALPKSEVKVYEDGMLLGSGKANGAGSWSVECELVAPYNLSTHSIYAEITTPTGTILTSETKTLTYDINALQVSKVTMYHWNPEMHQTYVSEFDFLNPKTSANQWTVYYPKKVFTYTIEFTSNDPERISNVILYVHTADGKIVPLNASFDEDKGMWYAEINMGTSSDGYYPVNCSVDFDYESEKFIDNEQLLSEYNSLTDLQEQLRSQNIAVDDIYNQIKEELKKDAINFDLIDTLYAQLHDIWGIPMPPLEDVEFDENELYNKLETFKQEYAIGSVDNLLESNLRSINYNIPEELGMGNISVSSCDGYDLSLISNDSTYVKFKVSGEKHIFTKATENAYVILDFEENICYNISLNTNSELNILLKSENGVSDIQNYSNTISEKINSIIGLLNSMLGAIDEVVEHIDKGLMFANEGFASAYIQLKNLKRLQAAGEYIAPQRIILLEFVVDGWEEEHKMLTGIKNSLTNFRAKVLGKLFGTYGVVMSFKECKEDLDKFINLYFSVPQPCENDQERADDIRGSIRNAGIAAGSYYVANISTDVCSLLSIGPAITAAPASGGSTLAVAFAAIAKIALSYTINALYRYSCDKFISKTQKDISLLKCIKDKKCGEPGMPPCPESETEPEPKNGNGGANQSGALNDNVKIDPSGFVYEAVPTNRIEGVQATIYYKETKEDMYGDLYDEVILWNAEEFAQKNPLFTDENGMYRWDVPQGLWQVKFEKDGYQTAYSEWLPVPPPQLEVNIGIVQNKQPEVIYARAYEDGVEVQFDKFMDLTTLSTNNIYVTANGEKIKGNIDFLDAELADEYASKDDPTAIRYASRIRFVPDTQLSVAIGELRLTVSREVLSYAGIPMTETFSQVLDIEKEVKFISASDIKVLYGEETELTVYAMPLEVAAGRVLHIHNSSNLIASVDTTEVTLDEEGKAVVKVKGELPGCTQLLFTIDEVTATGSATVDVVSEIITVNAPKSSLPSGTSVYSGTKIELTTDTKGAVIYFTTDGSCPCDRDGTRQKYTGPITISNDTKILAVTSIENGADEESEIVELNYAVKRSDVDIQLQKGWTWVSHNICNGIPVSELLSNNSVLRIVSQTEEVYKDTELGIVGSLEVLLPSESYMIESSAAIKLQFPNTVLFNPESSICLNEGCNWIGYPLSDTISLDNVFASIDVDTLDVIVGQRGFSQFDGEKWVGTLKVMSPGAGYVYYSKTAKNIVYNTSATTNDSIILTDLEFDIHKYQRLMPVIATIRANGELVDNNANYKVSAFCGNENRGIASVVNGLIMMNVYGNINEKIEFKVTDANGENLIVDNPPLLFSETVNGNINNPYVLETKKHIRAILDDLHFVLTESENGVVGTTPLGYQQLNANSVDVFAGYTTVNHSYFQNESILKHTYQWPNSSYASACSAGPVEALYNAYTYADSLGVLEYKAIAQIIYAQTALRAVNNLGCLPYHDLRNLKDSHPLNYLSQEDTYNEILKDLNEAIATLKMIKPGKESLMAIEGDLYDKGEVDYALSEYRWQKWVQLANTIKLRIAMYFTKPNHARAKQVAIEALSDEIGVLKEDFGPAYKKENTVHPYYLISSSNNGGLSDSRMNASFENILKRTGSPLIEKYFKKNSDNVTDKSNGNVTIKDTDYYGIRQGTDVGVKTEGQGYYNFSEVSEAFKYARQAWVTKEEVIFLKAEYALRWGDDADAKALYEEGVRSIFAKFDISSKADAYLAQKSVVQQKKGGKYYDIDYVDILDAKNNLPGRLNICVAWNNDDSYETKLEKIITQKWVAIFPNGHEAWVDYRRTGYPRLFPSVQQWTGEPTFPVELQLRRIPYDESDENIQLYDLPNIEQALSVFGQQGENSGGQRLYFEGDPNTYPWKYDKETGWFTPINFVESSSEDNTYSPEKELKLYPSPVRNHLTIEGCCAGDKIMIVDMTGRIYYSAISQSEKEIINVSSYPSGLYIVSVGEKVRKVIKID